MTVRPAGSINRTLRFEPTSSWTLADYEDGYDELIGLIFRTSGDLHLSGSIITDVPDVSAGVVYYLGTDGRLSESPPRSGYVVILGKGIERGTLLFDPQLPIDRGTYRAMRGSREATGSATP